MESVHPWSTRLTRDHATARAFQTTIFIETNNRLYRSGISSAIFVKPMQYLEVTANCAHPAYSLLSYWTTRYLGCDHPEECTIIYYLNYS